MTSVGRSVGMLLKLVNPLRQRLRERREVKDVSRLSRPRPKILEIFQKESERYGCEKACDSSKHGIQEQLRPGVAFGRNGAIEHLNDWEILRLRNLGLLELLRQERDEGLLYLHFAGKPDQFDPHFWDLGKWHREVAPVF